LALPSRERPQKGLRGALDALTGQARRLGGSLRRGTDGPRNPRAGEWMATDFDPHTLREWDEEDAAPFDLPPDPDAELAQSRRTAARGGARRGGGRGSPRDWEDDDWDAGWETGTWDTGWATDSRRSMDYARSDLRDEFGDSGFWTPGRRRAYDDADDALSQSLATLAALGAVGRPIGRIERVRMLMRRRPAAAAMLALFVLGFMLTCCAPLIPLLRLGYDAADAATRVGNLQAIFSGGATTIFNGAKLQEAKSEVDGITRDLYEINSAMNLVGAPLAAVNSTIRNYRLLARIGFDLTASADEGLDVAQTLLLPLQGGALSSNASTPGITPQDIQQAKAVLADAKVRVADAVAAYRSLNVAKLPGILQPSGRFGKYLSLLPTAQGVLGEMAPLLDSASTLLGVGQPAYYLVTVMDRSELRPGGGLQGNYGILTLEGGKQSKTSPMTFNDSYDVDKAYFAKIHQVGPNDCTTNLDQPPQYYWWWPYRINDTTPGCTLNWGLRDANLSADFPLNALTSMQIVQDAGEVSQAAPNGPLQGMIAITPVMVEQLLAPNVLGPIYLPDYNMTIDAANIEHEIHEHQLGASGPKSGDRKTFSHALGAALLDKLKTVHGAALKNVLTVVENNLKSKELQLYFRDPNAELVLRQLGLAGEVNRSGSDGFFVVDTNFGGNKANTYVREDQTDYVTLLPNGGALHHLRIGVTYTMTGAVYDGQENQRNYIDLQRTYLPGDATILGYSGFTPSIFAPGGCGGGFESPISDCTLLHAIKQPSTLSDVSGRSMVMGGVLVLCGEGTSGIQTFADFQQWSGDESAACWDRVLQHLPPIVHTQVIYLDYYTPHAFTMNAQGHGTYTEIVEKQPGSNDFLTVYVNTSQLHAGSPQTGTLGDGSLAITNEDQFNALIGTAKPFYPTQQIVTDTTIAVGF
jgi:hypothetical protein